MASDEPGAVHTALHKEITMANLKGMNVEALMSLRDQVEKRLLECRAEMEKQLAAIPGQPKSKSLKGKKVPPKYRSPSGETWAGRGARPRWMVEALKKGKKMESFLIKGRRAS
jgi:DNA-binding protein H-NS